jgi:uncharacterized membrane protein
VFWTDMLAVGTLVNVASTVAAMALFAADAPILWGLVLFLAHVPYSVLVFLGVWRSAARERSKWSSAAEVAAIIWLLAALVF